MRTRLFVRASNKTDKACSIASACLSNSMDLNCERSWSSESKPAAAAAVHVRSQDGCGLPFKRKRRTYVTLNTPELSDLNFIFLLT